jgi:hypothetical protein
MREARVAGCKGSLTGRVHRYGSRLRSGSKGIWKAGLAPGIFAFTTPKPQLEGFTKAMGPGSPMPSWRSGSNHGFCVTGGHSPIASELTPVASALGIRARRDPGTAVRTYHVGSDTTRKIGSFYFGEIRNFLFWSDTW